MSIAENLKRLRKAAGMSQEKLAEAAGVSQQLISQIEGGKNRDTTRLPELAKALGCTVEEIDPDYIITPEGREDVVAKFKSVLATDDEGALRNVAEHLDMVLLRIRSRSDGKPEETE